MRLDLSIILITYNLNKISSNYLYAILRSIPSKTLGVIFMFGALLVLLVIPITDFGRSRGIQFRPLSKIAFYIFIANFLILMQLGAKHLVVEDPFILLGQISTVLYFSCFFSNSSIYKFN